MKQLALALGLVAAVSGVASAHFLLMVPAAYSKQDSFGAPEKSPPCGQADPGTPMVAVPGEMTYAAGDTVTITVDEKIFHPGHYRIAVAQDEASLPADPTVTPKSSSPCGTADVEATPVLPVVADNLLVHTSSFSAPMSMQVKLPAGLTCAHCLLQVVEFMSDHPLNNPGGCFYHHCARVSITNGGVDAPPAVVTGPDVTSVDGTPSGCCDVRGSSPNLALIGLVGLALVRRRRRAA